MTSTRRVIALLAAFAFSVVVVAPAEAGRPAAGTRVDLSATGCTFTVTASWTRTDVTEVTILLRKSNGRVVKNNGQLASVDLSARTAWATWALSSIGAQVGDFDAWANLYGEGGAAGSALLEQRRSSTKIRAACVLESN